jgi:hypothetical protein
MAAVPFRGGVAAVVEEANREGEPEGAERHGEKEREGGTSVDEHRGMVRKRTAREGVWGVVKQNREDRYCNSNKHGGKRGLEGLSSNRGRTGTAIEKGAEGGENKRDCRHCGTHLVDRGQRDGGARDR